MKKYFIYELKKALIPFIVIAFSGIILYLMPIALESTYTDDYDASYIGNLMFVIGMACAIMPIVNFSYKMKRRSTDLYYSLPLTKTRQLAVKYIIGFLTIFAAYTLVYILGFIITAINYGKEASLIYFLPLYFAAIFPAYIIYSMASFAFTRANSVTDGIFFIIFAAFAVYLVVLLLGKFTRYYDDSYYDEYTLVRNNIYSGLFFPYTMLNEVTIVFQNLIYGESLAESSPFTNMSDPQAINLAVSFALFAALSIGSTIALFLTERGCKAENCNQVSESIFGYKTMIPLILVTICASAGKEWLLYADTLMLLLFLIGLMYLLSALYKKSFKIGWKFAVVLVCSVVIGILFGTVTDYMIW